MNKSFFKGGRSRNTGKKFVLRICPLIQGGASHQNLFPCAKGKEKVLIKGHIGFVGLVCEIVFAEPIGEAVANGFNALSCIFSGKTCTCTAGIVGVNGKEARIVGAGPKSGLTQSGMSANRTAGKV